MGAESQHAEKEIASERRLADPVAKPLAKYFGITTVEAMAAGCVPVVIDKAGQREIVRHGTDGYRWTTLAELEALTRMVVRDEALRARLAASAVERAETFSEEAFATRYVVAREMAGADGGVQVAGIAYGSSEGRRGMYSGLASIFTPYLSRSDTSQMSPGE